MVKLYDPEKVAEFFAEGEKWKDAKDEIILMHMNHRTHTVLMGKVLEELEETMKDSFGAVSILDVGCGTAMLLDYLEESRLLHRVVKYTGYDIVPKFLALAKERLGRCHIDAELKSEDFFGPGEKPVADVVVATQCLNTIFSEDQYGFLDMAIRKLWASAGKKLVFDLKDERAPHIHPNRLYYDPETVYSICRRITQNVSLVQTTKANFTVVLSRKELF